MGELGSEWCENRIAIRTAATTPHSTPLMADPIHKDMAATGQATLANVRSNDRYQGAAVHTFDPDASPEEKARIAGRARQDLKGNKEEEGAASRGLSSGMYAPQKCFRFSDVRFCFLIEVKVAASTTNAPPPTITVQDMDKLAEETAKAAPDPGDLNGRVMPGTLPTGAAPAIPDWYRVGWRAVGAIDAPPPGDDERDTNAIALFLSDMYYGQFYHNAGVIFFVRDSFTFAVLVPTAAIYRPSPPRTT